MKVLFTTLKSFREAIDFTREDMATKLGLSLHYYRKVERKAVPISEKIKADFFRIFGYKLSDSLEVHNDVKY